MRWFRFYDEVLEDPKVQKLSPKLFRVWVNLLCLANRGVPRGMLPSVDDMAFALRVLPEIAAATIDELRLAGLMDYVREVDSYMPHGWTLRQRESDDSVPRVRRFRNVTETPPDTDTDTEEIQKQRREGVFLGEKDFILPDGLLKRWVHAYPAVDVSGELLAAFEWTQANPANHKSNWQRFLVAWLKRAQDRAPRVIPSTAEPPKVVPTSPAILTLPTLTPEQLAENRRKMADMTRSLTEKLQ